MLGASFRTRRMRGGSAPAPVAWSAVSASGRLTLRVFAMVVALVALAGCRGDATVLVRARASGSGTVRVDVALDAEAAQALGKPASALATADLEKRGWAVEALKVATNGTGTFALERSFRNTAEANLILDELTGPTGPIHGIRLRRERSLLSTSLVLDGAVDMTKGAEPFGDAALAKLTGSQSVLGFDGSSVEKSQGKRVDQLVFLRLRGELPSGSGEWMLTSGKVTPVRLTSKTWAWGLAAGLGAILVGAVGLIVLRRR